MEWSGFEEPRRRLDERVRAWRIVVEHTMDTESSILAFGRRDSQPVVLKVIKTRGDEWRSAEVLDAFEGRGAVRVYDYVDGAMLLERLNPGQSLAGVALNGNDHEATAVLAEVIGKMSPRAPASALPSVHDWAQGFARHAASGDTQIPKRLASEAYRVYSELTDSQSQVRLLHGDLHHYNVLLDSQRGWLAVDPKGVVGELEYEIGAALRNPIERPDLFLDPSTIQKRVHLFASKLNLDGTRVLAWAFAQAVLSAIWCIEDGFTIKPDNSSITLANGIRPMLSSIFTA